MITIENMQHATALAKSLYLFLTTLMGQLQGEETQYKLNQSKFTLTLGQDDLHPTLPVNIDNAENQKQKENDNMPKPLKYGQGCLSLRIRKNKDGTEYKFYQIRYYDDYGIRHTTTAKTQAEALKLLNTNNKRTLRNSKRNKPISFGEDLQRWFDIFKKPKLQKNTIGSYQKLLNSIPIQTRKKLLHQVTEFELQNFLNTTVSI